MANLESLAGIDPRNKAVEKTARSFTPEGSSPDIIGVAYNVAAMVEVARSDSSVRVSTTLERTAFER